MHTPRPQTPCRKKRERPNSRSLFLFGSSKAYSQMIEAILIPLLVLYT